MNLYHLEEAIFEQIQILEEANQSDDLALAKYRQKANVNPVAVTVLSERLQKRRAALYNLNTFFNNWLEHNGVEARKQAQNAPSIINTYTSGNIDRDFATSKLFDL
jgi:hypothetical protein